MDAVAEGLIGYSELFQETLNQAETERGELLRLISAQEAQAKAALRPISSDAAKIAPLRLQQLVQDAPAAIKKRCIRAFVSEIVVGRSEIVVSGPKDALAEAVSEVSATPSTATAGKVRSFVPEWRTRQDSNL